MTKRDRRLQAAKEAIRNDDLVEARQLLHELVHDDPGNFTAWLWLAGLSKSPRASLEYIERAQRIDPDNPRVAKARAWAERRLRTEQGTEVATPAAATVGVPSSASATMEGESPERAPGRRSGRSWLALIAVSTVLLAILIVAGLFAWYRWSPEGTAAAEPKVTTGSAETIASAGNETAAAPQPAAVRGKFVAQHDPDTEPAESTGNQAVTPTPAMAAKTSKENVGNPRATWTVTPSPTPTPTSTPTPVPTFVNELSAPSDIVNRPLGVGPNERWIDVNLTRQTLVAYEGNKPVFQTLVSSGTWNHPTVTGQFRVWLRFQSQTMDGRRLGYNYYLENVPYVMYFYNDYALHGTFWHNNFGTPMSHGCVNLPTPAAEWIFYWSQIGTLVNVHY